MIVSKTNDIPDKIIVSVLGKVKIRQIRTYGKNEEKAMGTMIRKAKTMGANAIINFSYRGDGIWGIRNIYTGLAVIAEDIRKYWQSQKCSHCGKRVKVTDYFCGSCGTKQ